MPDEYVQVAVPVPPSMSEEDKERFRDRVTTECKLLAQAIARNLLAERLR